MALKPGSMQNWNPGSGGGRNDEVTTRLMNTEAQDAKDTMTGTNTLKEHQPKGGKPSGPFGMKGKGF